MQYLIFMFFAQNRLRFSPHRCRYGHFPVALTLRSNGSARVLSCSADPFPASHVALYHIWRHAKKLTISIIISENNEKWFITATLSYNMSFPLKNSLTFLTWDNYFVFPGSYHFRQQGLINNGLRSLARATIPNNHCYSIFHYTVP